MIAVLQQVEYATLTSSQTVSEINKGVIILLGVHKDDTQEDALKLAKKIVNARIFKDSNGKINLNILDTNGEALVVSNFTLQADTSHGNRPNFSNGADKEKALSLYELFASQLQHLGVKKVKLGVFGEHMNINTHLKGPITIIFDSHKL